MTTKILPMRRILQSSCWPYSGKRYSVWKGQKCILQTDDLTEAQDKAGEV